MSVDYGDGAIWTPPTICQTSFDWVSDNNLKKPVEPYGTIPIFKGLWVGVGIRAARPGSPIFSPDRAKPAEVEKIMFIKIGLNSGWARNCAKIQPADFQPEPG